MILHRDDPMLPAIRSLYEAEGIKNGHPNNTIKGSAFDTEFVTAYPDCRLVVTKEALTVESMLKIVYELLNDKLNIVKRSFSGGVNMASECYNPHLQMDCYPLCGISLVCSKCGYRNP